MQTYTHWLLTAVWQQQTGQPKEKTAVLTGSVMPDVPLTLLSIGYIIDRRYVRPHLPDKTRCSPTFNDLYFNNPWWIALHNLFHAPFPLFIMALLGYWQRQKPWGQKLFWFAAGCSFHSAIDIVTHVDDGPVLTFPFNWHTRFNAPVSYWDPNHGGRLFFVLEHLLDLFLIVYLLRRRKEA